uniref:Glyco_transf_41 domain-containing protein n=1 Tax=Steinernema glaseri TaxID=37863 RepID=A0A1I7ZE14_9BILA
MAECLSLSSPRNSNFRLPSSAISPVFRSHVYFLSHDHMFLDYDVCADRIQKIAAIINQGDMEIWIWVYGNTVTIRDPLIAEAAFYHSIV